MGVYFLRMSELQEHISLKEVLLEQFGQHFEVDVEAYFKDMKKLVIIDDCDKLINYGGTSVSIRNRFLVALKNCNVPTILASKTAIPEVKEIGKIKTYPLPRLNNDESLMFLLTGEKELFEVESDISILSKHEIIESARGKLGILRDQRKNFLDSISIKKKKRKRVSDNYRVKGESESNSEDDDSDEDEVHQVYGKEADSPEIGSRKKQIAQRIDGGYGRNQTRSPEVAKRSKY